MDETFRALAEKGVKFLSEPHDMPDWGMRLAHFYDPECNLLEIYSIIK